MYFDKRELRQYCVENNKEHYIGFIEKYLNLSINDKLELFENATIHNALKSAIFEDTENWWRGTLRKLKEMLPWNVYRQKWYNAFLFFYDHEQDEVGKIYQRMGLHKSGIREDDCE